MAETIPSAATTYKSLLDSSLEFAMAEGSRFFQGTGSVHETMQRIGQKFDELGIPYAVAGGMALMAHGFRRFTEDVDILVTAESLDRIHQELEGRGYLPPFTNSRHLRDTQTHVKIEFLISGGFPGDGKPKPVAFPDPAKISETIHGIRFANLPTLVELKLASGMTNTQRLKDLVDVEELIKSLRLPRTFASQLNPYVQPKFCELWDLHQPTIARYVLAIAEGESAELAASLLAAGIELETQPDRTLAPGHALYVTTDEQLARQFGMISEADFFKEDN